MALPAPDMLRRPLPAACVCPRQAQVSPAAQLDCSHRIWDIPLLLCTCLICSFTAEPLTCSLPLEAAPSSMP